MNTASIAALFGILISSQAFAVDCSQYTHKKDIRDAQGHLKEIGCNNASGCQWSAKQKKCMPELTDAQYKAQQKKPAQKTKRRY